MTEQLALQQKLHNPVRLTDESFEDYKQRRKSSHALNKLARGGRLFHASVWHTEEVDKEGKPFFKRHYKTFVKQKEA